TSHRWPAPTASFVFTPPPPAPPTVTALSRRQLLQLRASTALRRIAHSRVANSRRWRTALIELSVAVAIIATVAVLTNPAAPTDQQRLGGWGRQATPTVTALVEDLVPVQREVVGTGTARPNVSPVDLVALEDGLGKAEKLGPPPTAAAAATWRAALTEISEALRLLLPAGAFPSPATAAAASSILASAGQRLLQLGRTIPVG
ncbi:MAG TPA: hypothetical protein VLX59_03495, partial [Acidimicrobiales bacterium]|nr:hypothetical protein [Acidimicrobiales bacterium]